MKGHQYSLQLVGVSVSQQPTLRNNPEQKGALIQEVSP